MKRDVLVITFIGLAGLAVIGTLLTFLIKRKAQPQARIATVSAAEMPENTAQGLDGEEEAETLDDTGAREITCLGDFGTEKWSEGIVSYQGKRYIYKEGLQNYLFRGVDNDEKVAPAPDGISGGQSDAMFLVVIDQETKKIRIVSINRNAIVPVDVYDEEGNFVVRMDLQICLQHGYGDGGKLSCMRAEEAVDRLFAGVPISGYLSLNMGGLASVNDAAGGVELTPIESISRGDIVLTEGETVTLNGEQAYAYLRYRDVDKFGSANDRLKRQQQYICEFVKKLLRDPGLAGRVYDAGAEYIVASIDLAKLVNSASEMTFTDDDFYTVPGETEFKDDFERYNVDEDGMIRLILDVFYEELKTN